MDKNTQLSWIWIDLEMTGLDPQKNSILEIAVVLSDSTLTTLVHGPTLVIHQPEHVLAHMDDWNTRQHTTSGLIEKSVSSKLSLQEAEAQILAFVQQYIEPRAGYACGNSIWVDRMFLKHHMPKLDAYMHYRIIDVSSIKELVLAWFPHHKLLPYKKEEAHRASTDILASIEELAFYKKHFFIAP